MPLSNIYNIYKSLEEESILFSFKGIFTEALLSSVLQITELKLTRFEEKMQTKRRVFNVLVECLQNLHHHVDSGKKYDVLKQNLDVRTALLLVARLNGDYYIRSGNYVTKAEKDNLIERLDHINSLESDGLKELYKEVLSNGQLSNKGTAGLGMIDIARKSGNKLEYQFDNIEEDIYFFSLNIKIN